MRGSRELVGQAVANLVDNAVKYGAPNGEGAAEPVTVSAARDGDQVVITVADRGPGIPEAERERALERFVRLESARSRPGFGLGLSLAAAVARLHGGLLRLEDNAPGTEGAARSCRPRRRPESRDFPRSLPGTAEEREPKRLKRPAYLARTSPVRRAMPPEPASLAARLQGAPVLADAKRARARLADLLARAAEKPEADAARASRRDGPFHDLLLALADHSPFLWRLASADPARLARLAPRRPRDARALCAAQAARHRGFREAAPRRHRPRLPPRPRRARASRRARRPRRRLGRGGGDGGALRLRRRLRRRRGRRRAQGGRSAGTPHAPRPRRPRPGQRPRRARARQARGGRAELFQRHRPRRLLRSRARAAGRRGRGRHGLHPHRPVRRPPPRGAHRRRLRPPRRLPPAPGPSLDADRRVAPVRLHLLRDGRAELGARGSHQGAPGRGRSRLRRALPRRPRPVHLAKILRLRGHRRRARHEAADPRRARARRDRGRRPRHQARPRRHPRDRVLRPDAAARLRRPTPRACAAGAPSTCSAPSTTRAGSPRRRGTS